MKTENKLNEIIKFKPVNGVRGSKRAETFFPNGYGAMVLETKGELSFGILKGNLKNWDLISERDVVKGEVIRLLREVEMM